MRIFGHRGNPGFPRYGENTMTSFRQALDAGAAGIEFDVRRSADGQIVVIHDATVDRTTNGSGSVAALSYDDLRKLDAGHGDCIPLLSDVLNQFRNEQCMLNIELKEGHLATEIATMVRQHKMTDRVVVSAFDSEDRDAHSTAAWTELAGISPVIPVAPLITRKRFETIGETGFIELALAMRAAAIHPPRDVATPDLIRKAHDAELAVRVWTVNEPREVRQWRDLGVDELISDFPIRSLQALRQDDGTL